VETSGTGGELDLDGTITWFAKVSGISTTITMALYEIERSESGGTVTSTLVREVTRKYQVICDDQRFFIVGALRRALKLCRPSPP
jgi:hypothetical protein